MTVTMGKRGTVFIPKALREACRLEEGTKIDVSLENKTLVLSPSVHTRTRMGRRTVRRVRPRPSVHTRTRMDKNFDEAAALLASHGVTLEMALARLTEIKTRSEQAEETRDDGRSVAA